MFPRTVLKTVQMVTFLATIENHGLAMNALAVISILALLAITGRPMATSCGPAIKGLFKGRTERPIRYIFGGMAMLSVDQFLRLISVRAVIAAFLIASQISAAMHSDPEVATASQ
jgi:hypothetical protein